MKTVLHIIIFALYFANTNICNGQNYDDGYEKIITTIDFTSINPDTTIVHKQYNADGQLIPKPSKYISISYPTHIDTHQLSDQTKLIEFTWADQPKTYEKVIDSKHELIKIGLDHNQVDTMYFSTWKLGEKGKPVAGYEVNWIDTATYKLKEELSISELMTIRDNVRENSEFVNFTGTIRFYNRKRFTITDDYETRNKVEILLNRHLKPKRIKVNSWHDGHKMIFTNKYSYKYRANRLVKLKNKGKKGYVETISYIEYRPK